MKRSNQLLSFSAAIGAGLLAATAFAQQPASPPPAPPAQAAPAPDAPPPPRGPRGMTNEDRAAYFDAHVAAVHAGLRLTPDQERLWQPVETAVRDMGRQMMELRDQRRTEATPADPIDRMARMGDLATKRGQAMTRLADAARPLYASLSEDQKRRLRTLMRAPGREGGMMMRMGREDHGRHGGPHDRMARGDWRHDRGDMRGDGPDGRDDRGRGGRWNDWR